jgi:hypothetical protein
MSFKEIMGNSIFINAYRHSFTAKIVKFIWKKINKLNGGK